MPNGQELQTAIAARTGQLGQVFSLDDALDVLKTAKGLQEQRKQSDRAERQLQLSAGEAGFEFGPGGTISRIPTPTVQEQLAQFEQIPVPEGGVRVPSV